MTLFIQNSLGGNILDKLYSIDNELKHTLWGDIAKGIAIILVVMGHSFHTESGICKAIFLFHMPVFFFLAGYFMNFEKYKDNFGLLLKNMFKRIILPSIFIFLLFYDVYTKDGFLSMLYAIGKPIPEFGITIVGQMWFLYCLISVKVLLWCYLKLIEKFKINIIIGLIAASLIAYIGVKIGHIIFLPWSMDIALVVTYLAYIGYLCKEYNLFQKTKLCLILLPISLILGYIDYKYFGLSLNERYYSNSPLIAINISAFLSFSTVFISLFIEKVKILNKFLAYLGLNSLVIMIFHTIFYSPYNFMVWTMLRLLACIIMIEILALIPPLKNIYHIKSIKDVVNMKEV